MPDLLLELLSEEIPARMQGRAADDLRRLVTDALVAEGLLYEAALAYATPRRLALHVVGLPAKGKDLSEERRGPRVGAPEAAMAGFLKGAGLASAEQLRVVSDAKKGDYYVAVIERPGRPTPEVLSELLPGIVRTFPWPKSMRWGVASAEPGSLRWVRPLQSILCTFGSETETPEIVPLAVDGLVSWDATRGHRFMAPGPIQARRFDDYVALLEAAKVVIDSARRRDIIRHDARDLAFAQGFDVVEDEALLEEVAGLVEWPVVLIGSFDESFLAIPPEVIRATIRANQKCFVLRGSANGALANRFILVSNIEASDGGSAIVAGNERVVRARLSDAKFFWDTDRKTRLEDRLPKLRSIVFHEKLGTQFERVERIASLARELAPAVAADPDMAERAARLAKADLVTEMVGEFPELQGLMGRYYASAEGESPSVAAAIEEHYKPLGPSDRVPSDPVSVVVALADKIDTLVGFWAIDEKPTGSKDPYALRRSALGVIRLVIDNGLRLPLGPAVTAAVAAGFEVSADTGTCSGTLAALAAHRSREGYARTTRPDEGGPFASAVRGGLPAAWTRQEANPDQEAAFFDGQRLLEVEGFLRPLVSELLSFLHDRLKVYLRDRGARHDLIDAVLGAGADGSSQAAKARVAEGERPVPSGEVPPPAGERARVVAGSTASGNDDLLMVVRRVEALGAFLGTEDGRNLLAATKRAANILRIEEKKDGRAFDGMPDIAGLRADEEKALALALARASGAASEAVGREDFEGAMRALAELRPAVDAFFEKVTVNDPDPILRENRLKLLAMLRRATREVADFSKIEG